MKVFLSLMFVFISIDGQASPMAPWWKVACKEKNLKAAFGGRSYTNPRGNSSFYGNDMATIIGHLIKKDKPLPFKEIAKALRGLKLVTMEDEGHGGAYFPSILCKNGKVMAVRKVVKDDELFKAKALKKTLKPEKSAPIGMGRMASSKGGQVYETTTPGIKRFYFFSPELFNELKKVPAKGSKL